MSEPPLSERMVELVMLVLCEGLFLLSLCLPEEVMYATPSAVTSFLCLWLRALPLALLPPRAADESMLREAAVTRNIWRLPSAAGEERGNVAEERARDAEGRKRTFD